MSVNPKEPSHRLKPIDLSPLPEKPLVSILMPNYNYERYIGEAIRSVLQQTYQNWELIVCDDGSVDNSLMIIKQFAEREPRIRYIAKTNGGMASALNAAYKESRGDIIALLDSDDIFMPHKLEMVVKSFKSSSKTGFIIHKMRLIVDDKPGAIIPIFTRIESGYLAPQIYRRGGRWRYMPASSLCLRREVADLLFPIDEVLFRSEADAFLFTLAPILTEVAFLQSVLGYYRLHGRNLTGSGQLTPEGIRKTIATLERVAKGVNMRLEVLNLPPLDLNYNLNYNEQKTFLSLVERKTPLSQQVRNLFYLTEAMLKDDLYTSLQKLGGLFAYWTALLLPKNLRPLYLRNFTHPSQLKEWVRRLGNLLRKLKKP